MSKEKKGKAGGNGKQTVTVQPNPKPSEIGDGDKVETGHTPFKPRVTFKGVEEVDFEKVD